MFELTDADDAALEALCEKLRALLMVEPTTDEVVCMALVLTCIERMCARDNAGSAQACKDVAALCLMVAEELET